MKNEEILKDDTVIVGDCVHHIKVYKYVCPLCKEIIFCVLIDNQIVFGGEASGPEGECCVKCAVKQIVEWMTISPSRMLVLEVLNR